MADLLYMNVERPTFEAKPAIEPPLVLSEAFVERLKFEKPDGLNWDRIDAAVAVLKGEKDAVKPKAPEPEPTEQQKFWRDMYRSGELTPYQRNRPGISWEAMKMAWSDPQSQGETSRWMALDMALRGGADKSYNQLGDVKRRAIRSAVMVGNMVPNMAADILMSIPPNLLEKGFEEHLKQPLKDAKEKGSSEVVEAQEIARKKAVEELKSEDDIKAILKQIKPTPETQKVIDDLTSNVATIRMLGRIGEVMNDKNVTAIGNTVQRRLTGEKGWFTGEASDKLNDLLTAGYRDVAEDFLNGPTIESGFRILYQVPVVGALVEQGWTRWTNFQSSNEYAKGNLKAIYTGVGMFIGILRHVDDKGHHTPSWAITDSIWNHWPWLRKTVVGKDVPPTVASKT